MSTTNGQNGATEAAKPALDAFFEKRDEVVTALRGLGDIATALGTKTLRDRVDRELVRKLDEDRFHLVVVGEFNHGKTTFVNALLGEQALPVGVTPTTATIHHIRWADAARGHGRLRERASGEPSRSRRPSASPSAAARRPKTSTTSRSATRRRCSRSASCSSTRQA